MSKSIKLLDQLIEQAKIEDAFHQRDRVRDGLPVQAGESWMVYHLKLLKNTLKEEFDVK